MSYIKSLPINDTPEIFGLHDNANITFALNETNSLLTNILLLQPKTASGGGGSREEVSDVPLNFNQVCTYSVEWLHSLNGRISNLCCTLYSCSVCHTMMMNAQSNHTIAHCTKWLVSRINFIIVFLFLQSRL